MIKTGTTAMQAACGRRAGGMVLLYAFSHAYFGVGSLKNIFGGLPAIDRGLAAIFGAGWIFFWAGGLLLAAGRRVGSPVAKAGALVSGAALLAGHAVYGIPDDVQTALFVLARPFSAIGLFLLLIRVEQDGVRGPVAPLRWSLPLVGAMLPWVTAVFLHLIAGLPLARPAGLSFFLGIFMTLWCALPFGVLMLARSCCLPQARLIWTFAAAGTAIAGSYAYGQIWLQGFNAFLLALAPPVVFAGQAAGLLCGAVGERMRERGKA